MKQMRTADDLFKKCEKDGEELVRKRFAEDVYCTHDEKPIIQEWLRRKDEERALASSSKRDAREQETLSIAKEANRIAFSALAEARFANRSRWKDRISTIIAIIIAAIAAREDIIWLISWLINKITP
jgi:hypothetical protein